MIDYYKKTKQFQKPQLLKIYIDQLNEPIFSKQQAKNYNYLVLSAEKITHTKTASTEI